MRLELTEDQIAKIKDDGYIELKLGDYDFYIEILANGGLYEEVKIIKNHHGYYYAFDDGDLHKMVPTPPDHKWSQNKLCPCCGTALIYNFEYCPKCGQAIKYTEEKK